jgi:hypothetical protein
MVNIANNSLYHCDTPAADFWSVIAYSMKTKGFFRDLKRVDLSSQDIKKMKVKDDGSVDIYFGPEAPQGMEPNWVPIPYEIALNIVIELGKTRP